MNGIPAVLSGDALDWDQALRLFLLRCRAQNLSDATRGGYTRTLAAFSAYVTANGNPRPAEVTPQVIRSFIESRQAAGNSSETVDTRYRHLKTFFRFLHRDGLILTNPIAKVDRPRRERRFVRPFTEEQLRQLLAAIDTRDVLGLRDYALIVFLADTGLRISEALSLKVGDVDWTGNTVTVLGKGRKERRVAYGQTARNAVVAWIRRRGFAGQADPLWINRYGQPLERVYFAHRMKTYSRAAGIAADRLSPHALRHFFALSFLKNGGDVMSLQKLLGHSSLTMVRNYVNMTDEGAMAQHRRASPLDKMGPLPNERRRVRLK